MKTNIHLWSYLTQFILEWEIIQKKSCREIKTHFYYKFCQYQQLQYSIFCVLILIGFYMFRRTGHIQGAYTNVVKTYSNKIFYNNHTYEMCSFYLKYMIFKMYYKIIV